MFCPENTSKPQFQEVSYVYFPRSADNTLQWSVESRKRDFTVTFSIDPQTTCVHLASSKFKEREQKSSWQESHSITTQFIPLYLWDTNILRYLKLNLQTKPSEIRLGVFLPKACVCEEMHAAQNNTCPFFPIQRNLCLRQNRSDKENALMENRTRGSAIASHQANRAPSDRPCTDAQLNFSPNLSVSLQTSALQISASGRATENPSEVMTLHVICRDRALSDWYKGGVSIGWSSTSNTSDLLKAQARRWAGEKWVCDISERKMRKCNKIISHYHRQHPARAVRPNLSWIQSRAYSQILILILIKHAPALDNYPKVMGKNIHCTWRKCDKWGIMIF